MSRRTIAIIGNGISGITAARHIRKKSQDRIVVISSESDHFFSRTALMYVYMGHMKYEHTKPYEDWFWAKNDIELIKNYVNLVETENQKLHFRDGSTLVYDVLVIACGSKPNKFGWPGQNLPGVQGLYSLQDLETMEKNTSNGINRAVIVGGGLIGVEMAEMLLSRNYPVTFLVREKRFWGNVLPEGEAEMIGRHMINDHQVELKTSTELKEIVPDENGRVASVITSNDEVIACQFVGLTAGVSPNISFLEDSGIKTGRGVLVNEYLETNIANVYAIGDCAEFHQHPTGRKNIEQVWYTGRMMGETVAETITTDKTAYRPGNWFNSAKFFDIEYQTYGWVFPKKGENEEHFYWEGDKGRAALRLAYDKRNLQLNGLNAFGIRLRHQVVDRWLNEGRDIDYVLSHLRDANFDPEFYKRHEKSILQHYNKTNQKQLGLKAFSWKRIFQTSQGYE